MIISVITFFGMIITILISTIIFLMIIYVFLFDFCKKYNFLRHINRRKFASNNINPEMISVIPQINNSNVIINDYKYQKGRNYQK